MYDYPLVPFHAQTVLAPFHVQLDDHPFCDELPSAPFHGQHPFHDAVWPVVLPAGQGGRGDRYNKIAPLFHCNIITPLQYYHIIAARHNNHNNRHTLPVAVCAAGTAPQPFAELPAAPPGVLPGAAAAAAAVAVTAAAAAVAVTAAAIASAAAVAVAAAAIGSGAGSTAPASVAAGPTAPPWLPTQLGLKNETTDNFMTEAMQSYTVFGPESTRSLWDAQTCTCTCTCTGESGFQNSTSS